MNQVEGFVILCSIILGLVLLVHVITGLSPKKPIPSKGMQFKLPEKIRPKYNATRLCGWHIRVPVERKRLVVLDNKNCEDCKKEGSF